MLIALAFPTGHRYSIHHPKTAGACSHRLGVSEKYRVLRGNTGGRHKAGPELGWLGGSSVYSDGRRSAGKAGGKAGAGSNTRVITPASTRTTCGVRMFMARGLNVVSVDTRNGNDALLTRRSSKDSYAAVA